MLMGGGGSFSAGGPGKGMYSRLCKNKRDSCSGTNFYYDLILVFLTVYTLLIEQTFVF